MKDLQNANDYVKNDDQDNLEVHGDESNSCSVNLKLLDQQHSNQVSQTISNLDRDESTDIRTVKEAIIDLYLAIKIWSTDELDKKNDHNLAEEKTKLLCQADCFQILEYIRSNIEIIMNLKIDDLENNENKNTMQNTANITERSLGQETSVSKLTIESQNLI